MEHLWTALFCTIHLAVGFMAGRGGRNRDVVHAVPSSPGLSPAVVQFERAYQEFTPSLGQMPDHFQAALETLKRSVEVLAEQLAKAESQPSHTAAQAVAAAEDVQKCQSRALESAASGHPGSSMAPAERRGHSVPEYMAVFEYDLAAIARFERVVCHDLSATGISFFLDRPLAEGSRLIITLGQQAGGVLMAAKVIYSRPIIVRGEDRYRLGCAFERRLNPDEVEKLEPLLASAKQVN